jgi:hypothetical protein
VRLRSRAILRHSFLVEECVFSLADHDRYESFCGPLNAPPNIMRTLALLLLLAACQSRPDGSSPSAGSKVVETQPADDDFVQTRTSFEQRARARLQRLDARINELGNDASVHLRAQREQLAADIEEIDETGEAAWDNFRAGFERTFDNVERDLNSH